MSALQTAHPSLRVQLVPLTTEGDRTQHADDPGPEWGRGVFVKEIERALLDDDIDLAVHSLKDVPAAIPPDLALVAIPEREDPRDLLVSRDGRSLGALPTGSRVGTSSARRSAFLRSVRPDLCIANIRGNVDTRLRRLMGGDYDAVVLAQAGVARLGLMVRGVKLEPHLLPPAPGQGALGLEARADDTWVQGLVAPLHHEPTAAAVQAERAVMADFEAGCRLPVAALGTLRWDGTLELLAAVASPDGTHVLWVCECGTVGEPVALGLRAATVLRTLGATDLLATGTPS